MTDLVGSMISHYRIVGILGQGGMGAVYRARDEKLGRDLALKVLPTTTVADETDRARLLREARTASSLNDPHIVHVYEVGEDKGRDFIAMELIEGRTLREAIPAGGLPTETLFRYGFEIADAVAHAHERGIVHRDLKSSNVMLTGDGRVKIVDFGLARRVPLLGSESSMQDMGLTSSGVIVGTLSYLSPEVLRGAAADPRSDVWALGVVLYEMACGQLPFHGDSSSALAQAIERDPPPPLDSRVPSRLRDVIARCLAREPGQRYRNASELRIAIESARHEGEHSRRSTVRTLSWGAALVVVAVGGFWVARWHQPPPGGHRHGSQDTTAAVVTVTPPQADTLTARATLVRLASGRLEALAKGDTVHPGDRVAMEFWSADSCFVYVFDEDDHGNAFALFPLDGFETTNPLAPKTQFRLPGVRNRQSIFWQVSSAGGEENVYLLASRRRLGELENALARVPHAGAPGDDGYPRVEGKALLALRGIGGLSMGRLWADEDLSAATGPGVRSTVATLSRLFPKLQKSAEGRTDLWFWQLQLRSLRRGSTGG